MEKSVVTVYMIGNAHIDPAWLWRWQEGFAEVLATCRSALDRMNEYPDFVFTRADAATYKWIEDACPEMFEEIKQRVKEGRWSIVGGWWEQPDCNIPSGESFVRHELYGKRYFLEKFGLDVKVGYNVDSFGHNAGLPQILSKAGIKYYVFMRPDPREKDLPEPMFYWQGPDGSKVLAFRLHGPYCTWSPDLTEHLSASIKDRPKRTSAAACFYGVGNHGGGPTIENIEWIKKKAAEPGAPKLVFGTLEQMFEHALKERTDFPTVKGDLQHHAVGCYTAHSEIKRLNRLTENTLVTAEKFCAIAKMANGRPFPKARFAEAWQKLLFNQFHDILAGSSIPEACEDARSSVGAALDFAQYELNAVLSSMAWQTDSTGEGEPFVVFNPHAHPVKCAVYYDEKVKSLRDYTGRPVPVQTAVPLFEHSRVRSRKVFVDSLPPLGYRLYYAGDWDDLLDAPTLEASETRLENDLYRLDIDPKTGEIRQITDKQARAGVLSAPAGAVVLEDKSDTWSHGVESYTETAGRFANARIKVVETGPVRATVRVESKFGRSTLWQDISIYSQLAIIQFVITVDWHEKHRMLKFEFPLNLANTVATYDAAYAVATHPADGAENPGQKWLDVTGELKGFGSYGLSLINDSKYGFDVNGSTMRLSALRSPIYAWDLPKGPERGKRCRYMDQGLQSFTFVLLPHRGSWQDAGTVEQALLLNMPPVAVETPHHRGQWPGERSFGAISAQGIDLCAMKEAEDDDSLIVRLYETCGRPTETVLSIMGVDYPVAVGPFELKTLRIRSGRAVEVDLIERA